MVKKLFLILLSMAVSVGNICAHRTYFYLTKKGGENFKHNFSNMYGGLGHYFPKTKNDVGFTRLFLRCKNNEDEIEQAKATLKTLVYDLTDTGFASCLFKDGDGNGYIHVNPLEGTDCTDIGIDFKWTGISNIQLVETKALW